MVNESVYLGSLISNNFDTSIEIKRRILTAQRSYFAIRHLLTSKRISRSAKLTLKTLIRPVALYGSESWNMTAADENAIGIFERNNKVLWVIYGPKREGYLYKSRSNAEFYQLFREADIVKRININRLRWAGHVVRRTVDAPLKWVFQSDFVDGKRERGQPKKSWKEAVDRDSTALGLENWPKGQRSK